MHWVLAEPGLAAYDHFAVVGNKKGNQGIRS
jgi:hypothetical protein